MKLSDAERKQIENEMIFRRINEKLGFDMDKIDEGYRQEGNDHLVHDDIIEIYFKCECSDENCDVRLPMRLSMYRKIHTNRNAFIVKTDHQVDEIEKVIIKGPAYNVMQKKHSTPEPSDVLNKTTIDNSEK